MRMNTKETPIRDLKAKVIFQGTPIFHLRRNYRFLWICWYHTSCDSAKETTARAFLKAVLIQDLRHLPASETPWRGFPKANDTKPVFLQFLLINTTIWSVFLHENAVDHIRRALVRIDAKPQIPRASTCIAMLRHWTAPFQCPEKNGKGHISGI